MREIFCRYKLKECEDICTLVWIYPLYVICPKRKELTMKKGLDAMGYEE